MRLAKPCLLVLLTLAGCHSSAPSQSGPSLVEPYSPIDGAVGFETTLSKAAPDGTVEWSAEYSDKSGVTRFKFKLAPSSPSTTDKSLSFGKGAFVAIDGSEPQPLLNALKVALQAKTIPQRVKREDELPFTYAVLGTNLARYKDGGFGGHGTWTAIKLFLPANQDGDEAEVFLNLNSATNKGEFSIKDPDYGNDVLAAMAKVL
jgi:hypothetical protein